MNLNVNLNLKVDTLPELLATIAALREAGIQPTVTTSGDTVRATRPVWRGTHPLEGRYNLETKKQFRITKEDCKIVGWIDESGNPKAASEIPESMRLSAIAGRLLGLGVSKEEVQALCEMATPEDNGADDLPPGIAPLETVEGEADGEGEEGSALF